MNQETNNQTAKTTQKAHQKRVHESLADKPPKERDARTSEEN